jgi:hypothetical protein
MKKSLLGLITCLSILISTSCTQTLPGGSNTGGGVSPLTSWSCEIDGVPYSWSGTFSFPNVPGINDGKSMFVASLFGLDSVGVINLELPGNYGRPKLKFYLNLQNLSVGSYNSTPNSNSNSNTYFSLDWDTAYYQVPQDPGGFSSTMIGSAASFTVKIDTLSTNSVMNILNANINSGLGVGNIANAGLVTGTFSGTLYQGDIKHVTITNGKFRSLRYQ